MHDMHKSRIQDCFCMYVCAPSSIKETAERHRLRLYFNVCLAHTCMCIDACIGAHVCAFVSASAYTHACICMHTYTYTHIHTHAFPSPAFLILLCSQFTNRRFYCAVILQDRFESPSRSLNHLPFYTRSHASFDSVGSEVM